MRALLVDEPYIGLILSGRKTWEMRPGRCNIRELIGLIRIGSGQVVGIAQIVDCKEALTTREAYAASEDYHQIDPARQEAAIARGWNTPWVVSSAKYSEFNAKTARSR